MGSECVSEKEWGCGWSAGKGGNAWEMKETIYWKRNRKKGRANSETGGLEEAV